MSQNKSIFIGSFAFFPKFWALSITEIEKEGKLGPASFHPRKFSEGLFRGKEVHWNIANPLDHAKAPGDVSSRDKSSGLTDIIVPENEMSSGKLYSLSSPQQKIRSAKTETKKSAERYHTKPMNSSTKRPSNESPITGGVSATLRTFVSALCEFYNSRRIHSALHQTPDEVYFGTCNRQTIGI